MRFRWELWCANNYHYYRNLFTSSPSTFSFPFSIFIYSLQRYPFVQSQKARDLFISLKIYSKCENHVRFDLLSIHISFQSRNSCFFEDSSSFEDFLSIACEVQMNCYSTIHHKHRKKSLLSLQFQTHTRKTVFSFHSETHVIHKRDLI